MNFRSVGCGKTSIVERFDPIFSFLAPFDIESCLFGAIKRRKKLFGQHRSFDRRQIHQFRFNFQAYRHNLQLTDM